MNPEVAHDRVAVMRMVRHARMLVRIISLILVAVFSWLRISNLSLQPIANDQSVTTILQVSLIVYFLAWTFGSSWDLNNQELVFLKAPNRGKFPFSALLVIILLAAVFFILCQITSVRQFVLVLFLFWTINIISWRYMVSRLLKETLAYSRKSYEQKGREILMQRMEIVEEYIAGTWQWWRFSAGLVLLLSIGVAAYSKLGPWIAGKLSFESPMFTVASLIFFFVLSMEAWMWAKRIQTTTSLNLLDRLEESHELVPRDGSTIEMGE